MKMFRARSTAALLGEGIGCVRMGGFHSLFGAASMLESSEQREFNKGGLNKGEGEGTLESALLWDGAWENERFLGIPGILKSLGLNLLAAYH